MWSDYIYSEHSILPICAPGVEFDGISLLLDLTLAGTVQQRQT